MVFPATVSAVDTATVDTATVDTAKGKAHYEKLCASCHGSSGLGDGPIAANLPPSMKPRDFQAAEFKKVTDDASMKKLIKEGGPAFGLSPLMAAQKSLSDEDLDDVVAYIRSLKK